jgi:anti-sigma B factor antagonist/stage II sporulation protein AA (anti-sigma F factor antagonist)
MEAIDRRETDGIRIEHLNLMRGTFHEAQEVKYKLIEDMQTYKMIIIDLSLCEYMDSTFLGALIFSYRHSIVLYSSIKLVLNKNFLNITYLHRDLSRIFDVYFDLDKAIEEFKKESLWNVPLRIENKMTIKTAD